MSDKLRDSIGWRHGAWTRNIEMMPNGTYKEDFLQAHNDRGELLETLKKIAKIKPVTMLINDPDLMGLMDTLAIPYATIKAIIDESKHER